MAVTNVGSPVSSFTGAALATTIAVTRNGIAAGNLIIVCVTVDDAMTISKVSDGTTTVTVPDATADNTTLAQRVSIYSFKNHTAGNFTFTATFNVSADFRGIIVHELTGADTVSPFEGKAQATGTSAAPASGNVVPTPSVNGEYIVGYCAGQNALTTAGGYALLLNDTVTPSNSNGLAQAVAAATGASWTMTSGTWAAVAASYKPAVAAAGFVRPHIVVAKQSVVRKATW